MLFFLDGKQAEDADLPETEGNLICFANPEEKTRLIQTFAQAKGVKHEEEYYRPATRFESRFELDYIVLNVPDLEHIYGEQQKAEIFFTGKKLFIIHQSLPAAELLADALTEWPGPFPGPGKVLYHFFLILTKNDAAYLDALEEEIAALEEQIIEKAPENCTAAINDLRKRLLILKRYYEALFDLLQDLEENQNGFLSKEELKSFRIQTNRADRLSSAVLNLRDFVTQVREAYQNQLDIGLNETMKLFTVITAIFLPLTLIAGWYGMNLLMPEYQFPYMYPLIIGLSVLVVVVCVWYFKKNKWF